MNRALAWVKGHPYLTGAVVIVAGLAAYLILSSRQGGGAVTVANGSTGPSDASIQANAQLQMASLAAGVQSQSLQAQLAMAQYQGQTEVALSDRSLQATLAGIAANLQATTINTGAQRDVSLAQISANVQQSGQQSDFMKLMVLAMAKPSVIKQLSKTNLLGQVQSGGASNATTANLQQLLAHVNQGAIGNSGQGVM